MKWSKDENRMLSVLEIPLVEKRKKKWSYYFCYFCKPKIVYV